MRTRIGRRGGQRAEWRLQRREDRVVALIGRPSLWVRCSARRAVRQPSRQGSPSCSCLPSEARRGDRPDRRRAQRGDGAPNRARHDRRRREATWLERRDDGRSRREGGGLAAVISSRCPEEASGAHAVHFRLHLFRDAGSLASCSGVRRVRFRHCRGPRPPLRAWLFRIRTRARDCGRSW